MRIDSSGNVGIGTTSPTGNLEIAKIASGALGANLFLRNNAATAAGNAVQISMSANSGGDATSPTAKIVMTEAANAYSKLGFFTYAVDGVVERLTITSSGNVGIGTTSPSEKLSVLSADNVLATNIFAVRAQNLTQGVGISFSGIRKLTSGTNSDLNLDGAGSGYIILNANGGSGNVGIGTTSPGEKLTVYSATDTYATVRSASQVLAFNAGTGFIGSAATAIYNTSAIPMIFGTNNAERARIDSSGNLLVGRTSIVNPASSSDVGLTLAAQYNVIQAFRDSNNAMEVGRQGNNGPAVVFYKAGVSVGDISVTGSTTSYNSGSDYRLKDITGPLVDSGSFIDALKPKVGTWKSDGSKFVGFLAHEFAEVSPSSVQGEKDAVDAEGNPKYQGMQASSAEVIANLVAELQSLRQRVAALESN
jgi:hypothetical protein